MSPIHSTATRTLLIAMLYDFSENLPVADVRKVKAYCCNHLVSICQLAYKLTELRLPVYLFLVEDSMGDSEVAAVGVVVS